MAVDQSAAPQQQEGADPLQIIKGVEEALVNLQGALGKAGAPPEAMDALSSAVASYGEFVSVITGSAQPEGNAKQMVEADQMGANAVPADRPMGKNIRAVPA